MSAFGHLKIAASLLFINSKRVLALSLLLSNATHSEVKFLQHLAALTSKKFMIVTKFMSDNVLHICSENFNSKGEKNFQVWL